MKAWIHKPSSVKVKDWGIATTNDGNGSILICCHHFQTTYFPISQNITNRSFQHAVPYLWNKLSHSFSDPHPHLRGVARGGQGGASAPPSAKRTDIFSKEDIFFSGVFRPTWYDLPPKPKILATPLHLGLLYLNSHHSTHVVSTLSSPPLSPSITTLFHPGLKTHLFVKSFPP